MKILYYFKELPIPMYQWQRFHIFDELKIHECYVDVFNPLDYDTIEIANYKLIEYIKKNKYDLFMTPHNEKDLYLETLDKIKNIGILTLLICYDNLIIPYYHKNICSHFDLVWLTSQETSYLFKKWDSETIFLPYAANPYFMIPEKSIDEVEKVVFLGTPYGSRINKLNVLLTNNIDVDLYANIENRENFKSNKFNEQNLINYIEPMINLLKFKIGRNVIKGAIRQKILSNNTLDLNNEKLKIMKSVKLNDMRNIYNRYAISLSTTEARNTGILKKPVDIVNLRSFEIPMSAGIQLCRYTNELTQYFEEDKEILFYRSDDELIEKCEYYLRPENKKIRDRIRNNARKRAENDHTWFCRFRKVFDYLGLKY